MCCASGYFGLSRADGSSPGSHSSIWHGSLATHPLAPVIRAQTEAAGLRLGSSCDMDGPYRSEGGMNVISPTVGALVLYGTINAASYGLVRSRSTPSRSRGKTSKRFTSRPISKTSSTGMSSRSNDSSLLHYLEELPLAPYRALPLFIRLDFLILRR